ncbi:MAG: hypothetical protein ACYDBI_06140 [Thermoplasmataceae archaeon]
MSRYYDLTLSQPGIPSPLREWTSDPNGKYDPGALNVEFDIFAYNYSTPAGASTITVEGVALQDLSATANISGNAVPFAGLSLRLSGGMHAGLPLANPKQAGVLTTGSVYQAFGNWQGTEMSLSLVVVSSPYSTSMPGNIVWIWPKGTDLATSLVNCLSIAYPGIPVQVQMSNQIIAQENVMGAYGTLSQLARAVKESTQGLSGLDYNAIYLQDSSGNFTYPGVEITYRYGSYYIYDSSSQSTVYPVKIEFQDLVGQPTWIAPYTIQVKTVLRADLSVGSVLTMPQGYLSGPGATISQAASLPSYVRQSSIMQGTFMVNKLRHVGNFRGTGDEWVTILNCVPYNGG